MTSQPRPPDRQNGASQHAVDDWYDFLLACARNHEPHKNPAQSPIDELRIFDNSIHRVDDHIRLLAQNTRGWSKGYEEYLNLRMAIFATQATHGSFNLVSLLPKMDREALDDNTLELISGTFEELEQLFHSQEPAESKALLRRLEQLPRDAVVEEWYLPGPSFELWAEAVLTRARERTESQWAAVRVGGYSKLLKQLASSEGSESDRGSAEHVQKRLAGASHELLAHLRGEAGLSLEAIESLHVLESVETPPKEETPSRPKTTLLRVSTKLAETSGARDGDLLNTFVVELAKACRCEVCDFVIVEGSQLRPTVISDPVSELKELLEKPYHRAEGIAGSALLLPASGERRWVGTNHLPSDPRQSVNHTQSWSRATKSAIHDYWVFPVYHRDGACYGAFRVFNRLRSCWENGTPWSEAILWELREVAAWFEAAILPSLSESEVIPRTVAATAHSANVQHLKADLGLKWIDDDFLVRIVTQATQVAHRKVETLSLGCCHGVFADPARVLTHYHPYYAAGEVYFDDDDESRHLEDAAAAFAKINPVDGMFVFDPTGKGHNVINLPGNEPANTVSGTLGGIQRVSREYPQSLLLFLDRDQDCIRIIADGEIAADYYLSEASGEWTLRTYRKLIDLVIEKAPKKLAADEVREVFKSAIELSYKRIGAMLILGDGTPQDVSYEHETPLSDLNLRSLRLSEFADIAGADGAVRIEPKKGITAMGAIVRTSLDPDVQVSARPEGSRHSSAAAFSERAPDHMVFVVSENRPLTVMVNGTAIIERW
jgi:hypothetical protein